jgi:DNA ligase 3
MWQVVANPYSNTGGDMKQYHHPGCLFETFVKARPTTRVIMEPDDVRGYEDITEEDQKVINDLIDG